jgi:hypothetical protein
MSAKEIVFYAFYTVCFVVSIGTGIDMGFTGDSHSPPFPFSIELAGLIIGFISFIVDMKMANPIKVHQLGLTANGTVMAFVLMSAIV